MNTHTSRLFGLSNFLGLFLLIVIQIAGFLNLSIFGDWMRGGIRTNLEILRFYGGLIYIAAGWFFFTVFTLDEFEEKCKQGRNLNTVFVVLLPFFFFNVLIFWPAVVIYVLKQEKKKREQIQFFLKIMGKKGDRSNKFQ